MAQCPYCNNPVNEGAQFCMSCGKPLPSTKRCVKCQQPIAANAEFCSLCGAPQTVGKPQFCMKCGMRLSSNDRFCQRCGTPVGSLSAPQKPTATTVAPVAQPPIPAATPAAEPPIPAATPAAEPPIPAAEPPIPAAEPPIPAADPADEPPIPEAAPAPADEPSLPSIPESEPSEQTSDDRPTINDTESNDTQSFSAKWILFGLALVGFLVVAIYLIFNSDSSSEPDVSYVSFPTTTEEVSSQTVASQMFTYEPDGTSYSYTGEVNSAGQPEGFGTATWDDGRAYSGNFQSGKLHGNGNFSDTKNGYIFEGTFKDNYFSEGTITYSDGSSYKGTFKDGDLNDGTFTDASGSKKTVKGGKM